MSMCIEITLTSTVGNSHFDLQNKEPKFSDKGSKQSLSRAGNRETKLIIQQLICMIKDYRLVNNVTLSSLTEVINFVLLNSYN